MPFVKNDKRQYNWCSIFSLIQHYRISVEHFWGFLQLFSHWPESWTETGFTPQWHTNQMSSSEWAECVCVCVWSVSFCLYVSWPSVSRQTKKTAAKVTQQKREGWSERQKDRKKEREMQPGNDWRGWKKCQNIWGRNAFNNSPEHKKKNLQFLVLSQSIGFSVI